MTIDKICTIGPASSNKDTLSELMQHGMSIVRLNLSHGSHETHKEVINLVRTLSSDMQKPIKILGDLQGPKIRLGTIEEEKIELKAGQPFTLHITDILGNTCEASLDYAGLINDVKIGSTILINDGEVELTVHHISKEQVETIVKKGGTIASHKGVNVPGTALSLPAITDKDKQDIHFLLQENVDFIACSFVRQPSHIEKVRSFIHAQGKQSPYLVAKIETMEAIKNFPSICEAADGIMIARGDLGVELPFHWIPLLQKAMIYECNRTDTYVITATQMLQSMIHSSLPTRAEVTDVFQAVMDGTNAVMLSAESAAGDYPVESIETLRLVSHFAECVIKEAPFDFSNMIQLLDGSVEICGQEHSI